MKVIEEVTRAEIVEKFGNHRDAKYFAEWPYAHYYRVALTADEFRRLLMNSSPSKPFPESRDFPLLGEAAQEFVDRPAHLQEKHPWRGLDGVTVAQHLEAFRGGKRLEDCFISDRAPNMPPEGSYFISEGMHRLAAYALHRNLEVDDFEVTLYYMTDEPAVSAGMISSP